MALPLWAIKATIAAFKFVEANWVALSIAAASATYTTLSAKRQQRELESRAIERARFAIRDTPSATDVQMPVGDTAFHAIPVDWHQGADVSTAISRMRGAVFPNGQPTSRTPKNVRGNNVESFGAIIEAGRGRNNQYLLVPMCAGGGHMGTVSEVWVEDRDIRVGPTYNFDQRANDVLGHVIVEVGVSGSPSACAATFDPGRADAKFTGLSFVHLLGKQEPQNVQLATDRLPGVLLFLTGAGQWKSITAAGFGADTTQNDLATVIAGVASHPRFGVQLAASEIDFDLFNAARLIAEPFVPGFDAADNTSIPEDVRTLDGIGQLTYGLFPTRPRFPTNAAHRDNAATRKLRRYEPNGIIDTALSFGDLQNQLRQIAPGSFVFQRFNGKLGIKLPDANTPEANQVVKTIRDTDLVDEIQVGQPDDLSNSIAMRFPSAALDYAGDDREWPPEGSPAQMQFETADGETLQDTFDFQFVNNEFHAYTAGATSTLLRRREVYTLPMRTIALLLELGDIVEIDSDKQGINVYAMVIAWRPRSDGYFDVVCRRFVRTDFAWRPSANTPVVADAPAGAAVPAPTNVQLTVDQTTRETDLRWQIDASAALDLTGFDIERSLDNKATWQPHATLGVPDLTIHSAAGSRLTRVNQAGGYGTGATRIVVDDATSIELNAFVYIGTEVLLVTAKTGNTLTVSRGQEGTQPATIADDAEVKAAVVGQIGYGETLGGGAYEVAYRIQTRAGRRTSEQVESNTVSVAEGLGIDGKPGAAGIAQRFAVNIGAADPDANSEMRLREGSTDVTSLTADNAADVDTIELGIGSGTDAATVRRRRAYGALNAGDVVTVREALDEGGNTKFADYQVTAASTSPADLIADDTKKGKVVLTVEHLEHALESAIEASAIFGIAPALDGINGIPGTRGLSGYAESISRASRASSTANLNATRWHLDGAATDWTGNRTFSIRVTEAEEDKLRRVGVGALLTVYHDRDNWADYTLRSAVVYAGSGSTRTATVSLAFVEGFGKPPASGAVSLHFTPSGTAGIDGKPGRAGIAQTFTVNAGTADPDANSEIRLRDGTTNIASLTDANAADIDTIELGISSGDAAATVRRRRAYGALGAGDVVTVRDGNPITAWADYEVTARTPAAVDDSTRKVTLAVVHLEHVVETATTNPVTFGIAPSLDGIDGIPGIRGLAGYARSLSRPTRAATAAAVDSASEWFLGGSTSNWSGNRSLKVGVSATEEAQLSLVGAGALVTIYRDKDNWADYTLRSAATFAGTGAARTATLSLAHVESFGSPPTTGAVALHYTPAGKDGVGFGDIPVYQKLDRGKKVADLDLPAPTWNDSAQTLGGLGQWARAFPTGYDPRTEKVACVIVVVRSDNTASVVGVARLCEEAGDINAVFRRSVDEPSRLPDGTDAVPANTYDVQSSLPDGVGAAWVAVGNRRPNQDVWRWQRWQKIEGTDGKPGADGEAGYAKMLTRSVREDAIGDVDKATEWFLG